MFAVYLEASRTPGFPFSILPRCFLSGDLPPGRMTSNSSTCAA